MRAGDDIHQHALHAASVCILSIFHTWSATYTGKVTDRQGGDA